MKMLIDITEGKADSFLKLIKQHSSIKAKPISTPDAELLEEIKQAVKNADKVRKGKIKGRPAEELLNEL